ncbi:meiosis-specific nuclear structural protein 1, putative [Eimeria mitis]|uniref:Meiosis-specific nuclear structural protein 1 n=1 Tax=Eimeria mitis TaxID=44415 RepID=U6KIV6_9EIME|nr:meiosis-specific nuclear structural protein 1, putative [Eimeria mitis]CDJ36217.1 meiosis-specific nuclear structural protein 1, putative [Eimeria mitis]
MGKASNRLAVERRLERRRAEEQHNRALAEIEAARIHMVNLARSDARVEALRRQNATKADIGELSRNLEYTFEEQRAQQSIKEKQLHQRITDTLDNQLLREEAAALERQKICQESEEIRKLKEQLATARVNRERAAQLLERQLREADAAFEDARLELAMEEKRLAACEDARRQELDRSVQMRQVGLDLAAQIEERQRTKQEETAEKYAIEKEQVGAVVAQLLEEMENEKRQSMERRRLHAEMVAEATKERARQKQLLLENKIKEENEIREYLDMQRKRAEDLAREKELIRREKARILDELLQQQIRKQQEETDYAQLIANLYEFEREEQERLKEEAQKKKRQQERDALATAFKEQMEEKERRRQQQLAEEGQFRQELYAKFAREAKLEQMTLQRRKLALLEHNRQVEAIIQERRRQVSEERERDKEERRKLLELEAEKQAIIQQERERLLRENAELADFLPKNTLHNKREHNIVRSARQQLASIHLDPLAPLPRTLRTLPAGESTDIHT